MYINPIKCPNCQRIGRPGEENFQTGAGKIFCICNQEIDVENYKDQLILSTNIFCRLGGTSNYQEYGQLDLLPGQALQVNFKTAIDIGGHASSPNSCKP